MKTSILFLLIFYLFCSCNKMEEEVPTSFVQDIMVRVIIVDITQNDRLNHDSPAFWGDDYTNEIEVLYLCDGKKLTYLEYYTFMGGGDWFVIDDVEKSKFVRPPYGQNGESNEMTNGYYFIDCTSGAYVIEDGHEVYYTYIRYPNGSEDEIKVQLYEAKNLHLKDKVWINGELVYEIGFWGVKEHYYNAKYFPFMQPVVDDNGNQVGIMPAVSNAFVITKE